MLKFAFAGFRHAHIIGLYEKIKHHPDCTVVAAAEEDPAAARQAREQWRIELTHDNYRRMFDTVDFDVLAVGDYYARRGSLLLAALSAGKHVIADKPLCTDLIELQRVIELSRQKNLRVGGMLDLRTHGNVLAARELIRSGRLGTVHAIRFDGQHPLNYETRPGWYFEPGKHGGTINDIAIHGLDLAEWITGQSLERIVAARTWNAFADRHPHFHDAAQFMAVMNNGCGVMGDVSYFFPDSHGYKLPFYWRVTLWGRRGVIEFNYNDPGVKAAFDGDSIPVVLPPQPVARDYFDDFLAEIAGVPAELTTEHILSISRKALSLQKFADENREYQSKEYLL